MKGVSEQEDDSWMNRAFGDRTGEIPDAVSRLQTPKFAARLERRVSVLFTVGLAAFLILLVRLLSLQIGQDEAYGVRALRNRIREVPLPAARGRIKDRHGLVLVDNMPRFDLWYFPAAGGSYKRARALVHQATQAAALVGESRVAVLDLPVTPRSESVPFRVAEDIVLDLASFLEERRQEIPGFEVVVAPRRHYRYPRIFSHVVGYVGKPSKADLQDFHLKKPSPSQRLGKNGLERTFDVYLRGRPGRFRTLVDGLGRHVQRAGVEEPQRGWDLTLTLDAKLQKTAWRFLENRRGSIVVMDPRNGDILAMVSSPSFDPGVLSRRISAKEWNKLSQDPSSPLQNRAIAGLYPPGSIFKIVTATAGLETGVLDSGGTKFCIGMWQYHGSYAWPFFCHTSHGTVAINEAISRSCNIFFFKSAIQIRASALNRYALMYGFGQKTGVPLPLEARGPHTQPCLEAPQPGNILGSRRYHPHGHRPG